jgi:hypothetical protein
VSNRILINDCWCDERLITKAEVSTCLAYTGFRGGLEHLKIETRLIDERLEIEATACCRILDTRFLCDFGNEFVNLLESGL